MASVNLEKNNNTNPYHTQCNEMTKRERERERERERVIIVNVSMNTVTNCQLRH